MEQGLRLLIQLVLEFSPVIVSLIQKRTEESLATTNYPLPHVIQEVAQIINTKINTNNSSTGFEQEKFLQQQLAVYYRETQLQITKQERDTALKLPEVHK